MKRLFRTLAAVMLLGMFLLALVLPVAAQVTPTSIGTISGTPTVITTSGTSNVLTALTVRQGKYLAVSPYFAGTNAGTANLTLVWDLSLDGTNYCTLGTISQTFAQNGTTGVRGYSIIAPTSIGPARYIRLKTVSNAHTDSLFLTNVMYSWSP